MEKNRRRQIMLLIEFGSPKYIGFKETALS
jgi:hypothetical protein